MSPALKPLVVFTMRTTPNPIKVALIMEELGLPYEEKEVRMEDLKKEPYISVNPNGRVPSLTDPNNKDITLFETGAIIDYLVAEYDAEGKLSYKTSPEKYLTSSWGYFQVSGQGPYMGQLAWFNHFHPEKVPSAIERYAKETRRISEVIDGQLAKNGTGYLVGDRATYADIMFLPYFRGMAFTAPGVDISDLKNLQSWLQKLLARPAVTKVFSIVDAKAAV